MKTLLTIACTLFWIGISFAQTAGTIKYVESVKLDIEAPDGIDLGDMLPDAITTNKDLIFDGKVSVFKEAKDNETEDTRISSDDGSFEMVFKTSDSEQIFYTDMAVKKFIEQTDFMGKEFLIEGEVSKHKWRLTNEKIKYLGYVCQKAEMTEPAREEGEEDRHVVAWFTSELPASVGPQHFNQLPGAILMINIDDGQTEIKATEVDLTKPDPELLKKPKKGKKVTSEEFDQIVEEKMAEMQRENGGRGRSIMIRG